MAAVEHDSFQHTIRHHAKFVSSTMKDGGGVRESYRMAKATREIMFGFNQKKDNFQKTKQLKLW